MLEVLRGPSPGRRIRLRRSVVILGRGPEVDIRLVARGVSRAHAKIVVGREGIINVVDLGSTNGTFLNRTRIDVAVVRDGDRIALGRHILVQLGRAPEPTLTPVGSHPLTPRQLEVARLVALGSTNSEVAGYLGVSPRTVSSHLENVYAQLAIGSRAELTRWLFEHGLQEEPVD
ncbi:MAG: FHA domain-containing protein [Myxococcota bacterium]